MSHNPGYSFSYTAGAGNGGSKTAVSGGGGVGTPGSGASTVGAGSGQYFTPKLGNGIGGFVFSSGAGNGGIPLSGTFSSPVRFPLEPLETEDPAKAPLKQRVKELEDKVSSLEAITQEQAVCLQELYSLIDSLKQNKSRQRPLEESDYWKER